jgi:predicted RNA-binding Zn-ribbon protein involved in translation (DUF1610 family)
MSQPHVCTPNATVPCQECKVRLTCRNCGHKGLVNAGRLPSPDASGNLPPLWEMTLVYECPACGHEVQDCLEGAGLGKEWDRV